MRIVYRALSTAAFLIALSAARCAYGQGGATGAISGTVVDTSGGSVAGADVQIIDTRTETVVRKLPAGSDGSFVVPLLPPGTYSVVVNKSGFSQAKADGIAVRVTETTKVTITLKPGAVSEKVEISAQIATVDTTSATTGESLGTETVRELPLATQNYQQLLTLSAGAQSELNAAAQLGRGSVKLFVNGQREDNNNYLIEGISATDYNVAQATYVPLPNPDVIQEFKVQTSLYDASQGRNGGGNVNAILKSGTREWHGDIYEFFRNDVLNANEYFVNRQGQPRPAVKQNIFGGSLGGPVVKENYGFFFVNYQGTRQRSGLSPGTFISTNIPYIPSSKPIAACLASILSCLRCSISNKTSLEVAPEVTCSRHQRMFPPAPSSATPRTRCPLWSVVRENIQTISSRATGIANSEAEQTSFQRDSSFPIRKAFFRLALATCRNPWGARSPAASVQHR